MRAFYLQCFVTFLFFIVLNKCFDFVFYVLYCNIHVYTIINVACDIV